MSDKHKQVNVQKEFKLLGPCKLLHEKVCDENETKKERKKENDTWVKIFLMEGKLRKSPEINFNELQDNDSSYNKGYLFSKRMNGCQGDGF